MEVARITFFYTIYIFRVEAAYLLLHELTQVKYEGHMGRKQEIQKNYL